jgi:DIM1 family U5 snRNP protein
MLPHLDSGYAVDQAILSEEDRVVIIRFGHDWDPVGSCHFHEENELNCS